MEAFEKSILDWAMRYCYKLTVEFEFHVRSDQTVDINELALGCSVPHGKLPFRFNRCELNCDVEGSALTTLENVPLEVHGWFNCSHNYLRSLEFCPKFVQGDFDCSGNQIPLWEYRYLLFSEIHGEIRTPSSALDEFFKRYQNKKHLIPQALKELRKLQNNR